MDFETALELFTEHCTRTWHNIAGREGGYPDAVEEIGEHVAVASCDYYDDGQPTLKVYTKAAILKWAEPVQMWLDAGISAEYFEVGNPDGTQPTATETTKAIKDYIEENGTPLNCAALRSALASVRAGEDCTPYDNTTLHMANLIIELQNAGAVTPQNEEDMVNNIDDFSQEELLRVLLRIGVLITKADTQ
jgi:hypothetical protein